MLALGLAAGALAACRPGVSAPDQPSAPSFAFTSFDGRQISLDTLAGSVVVLNFWASWCGPCREEMPRFEAASRSYRDRDVVFLGLAVQDETAPATAFVGRVGITYPSRLDQGNAISLRYGLVGLPTTVVIARDGTIARTWRGPLSESQLASLLDEVAR